MLTETVPRSCLLYTHLPLDGFPSAPGLEALCLRDNSLPRPCPRKQLSPSHPLLAVCQGNDVRVPGGRGRDLREGCLGRGDGPCGSEDTGQDTLRAASYEPSLLHGEGVAGGSGSGSGWTAGLCAQQR